MYLYILRQRLVQLTTLSETLIEVLKQSGMIVADFFHEALQRFGGLAKTDVHVHLCGSTWTIGIVRATFMEFAGLRVDQVSSRWYKSTSLNFVEIQADSCRSHSHVVSHGVLLCDRPVERLNGYVGLGMHDQSLKQICQGERFGTRVVNAPIVGEEPGDHCVEIDGERNASRWPISQKNDPVTLHPRPKITCWYRCGKAFTQHMVLKTSAIPLQINSNTQSQFLDHNICQTVTKRLAKASGVVSIYQMRPRLTACTGGKIVWTSCKLQMQWQIVPSQKALHGPR